MSKTDAAYMRAYRARKRAEAATVLASNLTTMEGLADATNVVMARQAARITELEEEVRHLKHELAAQPWKHAFNSRPFTAVPKKGK